MTSGGGYDIFSKIKSLLSSIGLSRNKDNSLKRRASDHEDHPVMPKYRRVSNVFPQIINSTFDDESTFVPPRHLRLSNSKQRIPDILNNFNMTHPTTSRTKIQTYADVEYSDDDDDIVLLNPRNKSSASGIPNLQRLEKKSIIFPDHIPVIVENKLFAGPNKGDRRMVNGNTSDNPPPPLIRTFNRHSSASTMKPPEMRDTWHKRLSAKNSRESVKQAPPPIPPLIDARTGKITASAIPVADRAGNFGSTRSYVNGFDLSRGYRSGTRQPDTSVSQQSIIGNSSTTNNRSNSSIIKKSSWVSDRNTYLTLLEKLVPGLYKSKNTEQNRQQLAQLAEARGHSKEPKIVATINLSDDETQPKEIIDLSDDDNQMISVCRKLQGPTKSEKIDELPQVKPVNSLQDKLDTNPTLQPDWLDKLQANYELKRQLSSQKIAEALEDSQQRERETEKHSKSLEQRFRACILDRQTIVLDESDSEEEEEFPEFTDEQVSLIKRSIHRGPQDEVLISKFNMNITRRDINTLVGDTWLNDEVINFYMNLLMERSEIRASEGLPRVYAMNTFFVQRLLQSGHSAVRRWTRKVDIFSYDVIPVPVHVGQVHWCMAIIHLRNRTIKYYDSMGTPNPKLLNALEEYLLEESLDKRKERFDTSKFTKESVASAPRQMNGSDCGVFSCMFAEYITRNREITFSQQHMPYFRQKIILEIVQGKLLL